MDPLTVVEWLLENANIATNTGFKSATFLADPQKKPYTNFVDIINEVRNRMRPQPGAAGASRLPGAAVQEGPVAAEVIVTGQAARAIGAEVAEAANIGRWGVSQETAR